jgi:hypothetical protein
MIAPEAPRDLKRDDIIKELEQAYENAKTNKTPTFKERRKDEIKTYLKKLKIDGKTPVVITLQDEGERLTHEKVKDIMQPVGATGPAPPVVLSKGNILSGGTAIMRSAKNNIFDRAMRDAMQGIQSDKINTLTDFKRWKEYLQNKVPSLQDKDKWKPVENSFIKGVIDGFVKEGILVKDVDTGTMRPSDEEIAGYLLSRKDAEGVIGHTNNFKIASLAEMVPASGIDQVESGKLVFQSHAGKKTPIRLTGHVIIEKEPDIDKLVDILGTNPKNGFLPRGFEHEDDEVKDLMNTFVVLAR